MNEDERARGSSEAAGESAPGEEAAGEKAVGEKVAGGMGSRTGGASHRVERTLELAQLELSPSAADKARGRAAFGLPEPPPMPIDPRPTAWAALAASGKAGALVAALLLGVGLVAGYWLGRAEPRPVAPSPASDVAAVAALPGAALPAKATAPIDPSFDATLAARSAAASGAPSDAGGVVPDENAPARAAALPPRAPSLRGPDRASKAPTTARGVSSADAAPAQLARAGSRNTEELALMRRIERSLRNDQPALALALLAEAEAHFPHSALDEERVAASVMAHCGLQDPGHARRAEDFLQSRPRSVYRTRVLAACGAAGVPHAPDNPTTASEGKRSRGDQ